MLRFGAVLGLALLTLGVHAQAARPWRIVILAGTDPAQPIYVLHDRALRSRLQELSPNGVEFYTDAIDGYRFDDPELIDISFELLRRKYEHVEVDFVLGVADPAQDFAERFHDHVWPNKPVLVVSYEEAWLRRTAPKGISYLPFDLDVEGTLKLAERLQPQARRLVIVSGVTAFEAYWARRTLESAKQSGTRRWQPEIWLGLPMDEMQRKLSALDGSTAVIFTSMVRDSTGRGLFSAEAVKPMVAASGAPLYGWYPPYLGQGLMAGSIFDFEQNGRRAAEHIAAVLAKRESPGSELQPTGSRCRINVTRAQVLGIDLKLAPADCIFSNYPPSLWRDYRTTVIAAAALMTLQFLTIAALVYQRQRRRQAESEAQRRGAELQHAMRVATAGELSASIAHEVSQPLTAIAANTEAATLMLQSDPQQTNELQAIFADISRDASRANEVIRRLRALLRKQAVNFSRVDLSSVVDEALSMLEGEARRRRITVLRDVRLTHAEVNGDRVQLQQVLLNLAINAMDAMLEMEDGRRVLTIGLHAAKDGFELYVADRGRGIAIEDRPRIFQSFFTTKSRGMGLGLSIVKTLVDAHAAHIRVTEVESGGCVFTIWLPKASSTA